jgi:type II secretory pathway predicted ATPase ExeA
MIDKLQAHYGFTRMPFGRDLAPGMLHRHAAHNEACARITWCIAERAIGVITGEVGAGAPRVWWRLDSPQMLWSGWPLSSTVPPPGGTTV